MTTSVKMRKIVKIDETKCDGCGECAPSCAEGAIKIVNGKARLVADNLCDGLGACLGNCPQGAITIEERPADEFDHHAVEKHLQAARPPAMTFSPLRPTAAPTLAPAPAPAGGCPGSRMRVFTPASPAPAPLSAATTGAGPSQLRQWPVQLTLLPTQGPIWQDADVLLAADCVPFALPDFHGTMLGGKTLAIACPKLDDVQSYVQKLAVIFSQNSIRSITIARMEVPCCSGLVRITHAALAQAGREDIPVHEVVVGVRGEVRQ